MTTLLQSSTSELANQFVGSACLCYDDPHYDHRSFHTRASDMLLSHPELAEASIWSAAAAGNTLAVEAFLNQDPTLVNQAGPHGWVPLICACYSRLKRTEPANSTCQVVKLLLDRGADPNAFTLKRNDPPESDQSRRFTALTGLFGGGSTGLANQPPHPQWHELAETLLEHGANPADAQALWINQAASLEILLSHGLKPDALTQTPAGEITLLGREISLAARNGHTDRVKLLLAHRARTDEMFQGETPWEHAIKHGHIEIARLLEEAGAPTRELTQLERFQSLCLAGDETRAQALLALTPELLEQAPKSMVLMATGTGRLEAVRLVLNLGFDPNHIDEVAPLHNAVGKNEAVVRLLLERGASPAVREPFYDATPVGWADFFELTQMRDLLLSEGAICLFDALDFGRLDRIPDILARDPEALNRPFAKCLSREPNPREHNPEDWQTPLARMQQRGNAEAVRILLAHGAAPPCHDPAEKPPLSRLST